MKHVTYSWLIWAVLIVCIIFAVKAAAIDYRPDGSFALEDDEQEECAKGGGCLLITRQQLMEIREAFQLLKDKAAACRS